MPHECTLAALRAAALAHARFVCPGVGLFRIRLEFADGSELRLCANGAPCAPPPPAEPPLSPTAENILEALADLAPGAGLTAAQLAAAAGNAAGGAHFNREKAKLLRAGRIIYDRSGFRLPD